MNNTTLLNIVLVVVVLIVIHYLAPFISRLWILFIARKKGRRIGTIQQHKISGYIAVEFNSPGLKVAGAKLSKETLDKINSMAKHVITGEYERLANKFNPKIKALAEKVKSLQSKKTVVLKSIVKPKIITKILDKGKEVFENSVLGANFWRVTMIVWFICFLLVLDTKVSGEWISQIGIFNKNDMLLGTSIIDSYKFLDNLNVSINTVLGFLMNFSLLMITHALFRKATMPKIFNHIITKIIALVFVFGSVIYLRFLLPNSTQAVKDVMLTIIWLFLFITAYVLLHYVFKQVKSPSHVIGNLLFFLIIPLSIVSMVFGGVTTVIVTILEGVIAAGFELKKARIEQVKANLTAVKQNLEDGIYEGITDEERA